MPPSGADLVKQWEKSPEVVMGIAEHHFETPNTSTWGFSSFPPPDAISSARAGSQKRVSGQLSETFPQVSLWKDYCQQFQRCFENRFAIQAGREVRILVKPEDN